MGHLTFVVGLGTLQLAPDALRFMLDLMEAGQPVLRPSKLLCQKLIQSRLVFLDYLAPQLRELIDAEPLFVG